MEREFSATVYKQGINPCVDVPEQAGQAFGIKGYLPVRGTLNGHPIRANLAPGGGRSRQHINGEMRKTAQVGVGDQVSLVLEADPDRRAVLMPEAFAQALAQNPEAKAKYESMSPSRQKEILACLNWLKRPETLQRNIDKILHKLETEGRQF